VLLVWQKFWLFINHLNQDFHDFRISKIAENHLDNLLILKILIQTNSDTLNMHWQNVAELNSELEFCFTQIQQQRMADVPILNPALRVQAVDFQLFQQTWIGILITPWFMNLLYFHGDNALVGSKITHLFPAGQFEFIVSHEQELGFYQSCSLYSPMFDFQQQEIAVQTARAALQELLKIPKPANMSRRDLLRGQFGNRVAL
jgi:[NiFe] hydrogenase assembly HybE family chaperone